MFDVSQLAVIHTFSPKGLVWPDLRTNCAELPNGDVLSLGKQKITKIDLNKKIVQFYIDHAI